MNTGRQPQPSFPVKLANDGQELFDRRPLSPYHIGRLIVSKESFMRRSPFFVVFAAAVICMTVGHSQTIHRDDINRFLGKVDREKFHPDSIQTITFADWTLDTVDTRNKHRWSWDHRQSGRDSLWFLIDTARQEPLANPGGNQYYLKNYRFYVMQDVSGYGGAPSILTVWKPVRGDSLTLVYAQSCRLPDGLSTCWIAKWAVFPDQSVLLCIQSGGGDADEEWGGCLFLRSALPGLFVPFYKANWASRDMIRISCDFSHLFKPCYRIVETETHFVADSLWQGVDEDGWKIDSARAEVVDVWDLAKEHFAIDTTKIELHYMPNDQLEIPSKKKAAGH